MDAIDILGALLGKKMQSSGPGSDVLKDMMAGKSRQPAPPRQPTPPSRSRPRSIDETARSLEELLNVSQEHRSSRQASPPQPAPTARRPAPRPQASESDSLNEQAEVLVRAMVQAAKSDGQITTAEQDEIIRQLGDVSQDEIEFLRSEFAKQANAREFAWSVPLGMEEQVYQISLIAIDLDEYKEAQYLADLAHGLRLAPERCNAIHKRLGAPVIFQP